MSNFIQTAIHDLKNERSIFHSEDDLKLALALKIKEQNPQFKIRLEKPFSIEMVEPVESKKEHKVNASVDILVYTEQGVPVPIELKYKTKKLDTCVDVDGEKYDLTQQGAHNIGRYNFRKDIYRVEKQLEQLDNAEVGYVLKITNDLAYINNDVSETGNLDKNFSCHEGATIESGERHWHYKGTDKKHWTIIKGQRFLLDLKNDYPVRWETYSNVKNSEFKYCLIEVKK